MLILGIPTAVFSHISVSTSLIIYSLYCPFSIVFCMLLTKSIKATHQHEQNDEYEC